MNTTSLGVIGGMGPEATSYFYDQVVRHTDASCDQEHLNMVILSCASMPDRTRAIATGEHEELLATMRSCTQALEHLKVGHIAIPCNTSHYFYDDIQRSTSVPIIHMPRETVRHAVHTIPGVRRIGIMGTDGTVGAGVYAKECEALGVTAVSPDAEHQRDVMSIIYDDVKAGRTPDMAKFERVVAHLEKRGCECVILACTELSVLKQYREPPAHVIDAMDVLVHESIVRCGYPYRA